MSRCIAPAIADYYPVWELYYGGGGTKPVKNWDVKVLPGDSVGAAVVFDGRQADGSLKFTLRFWNWSAEDRGEVWDFSEAVYTDPGVRLEDALSNSACILENEKNNRLAKFNSPLVFSQCYANGLPISASTGLRWDMFDKSKKNQLAKTGTLGKFGSFSVRWLRYP
jgi:hypothetical protein